MMIAALALLLMLGGTARAADIPAADKTCTTDADCTLVETSCTSCCPTFDPNEMAAVSAAKASAYQNANICTADHIKSCGVPECGMVPVPYPAASCQSGTCTVVMHPADPPAAH